MRTPAIICTSMSCCQAARLCSKGSWACVTNQPSGDITISDGVEFSDNFNTGAVDCCGSGSSSSFATVVGTEDFWIFLYTRIEHYQRIEGTNDQGYEVYIRRNVHAVFLYCQMARTGSELVGR